MPFLSVGAALHGIRLWVLICVLIASVPDLCILFTFKLELKISKLQRVEDQLYLLISFYEFLTDL